MSIDELVTRRKALLEEIEAIDKALLAEGLVVASAASDRGPTKRTQLLALVKAGQVRCGDVVRKLGVSRPNALALLSRAAKEGAIVRVEHGLYALPEAK